MKGSKEIMFGSGILSFLEQSYLGWKQYNKTCRELSALSDRELHDIGLHRGDIQRVAAQGKKYKK